MIVGILEAFGEFMIIKDIKFYNLLKKLKIKNDKKNKKVIV